MVSLSGMYVYNACTHTHTYIYAYSYTYICVYRNALGWLSACVCVASCWTVCVCVLCFLCFCLSFRFVHNIN